MKNLFVILALTLITANAFASSHTIKGKELVKYIEAIERALEQNPLTCKSNNNDTWSTASRWDERNGNTYYAYSVAKSAELENDGQQEFLTILGGRYLNDDSFKARITIIDHKNVASIEFNGSFSKQQEVEVSIDPPKIVTQTTTYTGYSFECR